MKLKNVLHDKERLIMPQSLSVNQLRGFGDMLLQEILKPRSEIAGNAYFSSHFLHLQSFLGG